MRQVKLQEKVDEIFTQQGFETETDGNRLTAEKKDQKLEIKIFSSQEYTLEEVKKSSEPGEKVFVDEKLREVKEKLENEVSVIKEQNQGPDLSVPSYERIGDIVMINDLDEVSEEEAVKGILQHNPGIDSILLKTGKRSGEFRLGDYRKLYGEETETVHREHGVRIKVDPTESFFSEREGTERKRVFESVEPGETVLVMFSGVGPFPVTIGRNSEPEKVTGVEKNPEAVSYARENVELNNLEEKIEIIEGDVAEVCPDLGKFDRVLMPSPTNSLEFLDEALDCVAENGVLVVYSVEDRDDLYSRVISEVRDTAREKGLDVEVLEKRVTADFSPSKRKVAVEFRVSNQ